MNRVVNKIYMSKRKFLVTNRDHFAMRHTQERVSQELKTDKKHTDPHRDLLLPLDLTKKQPWQGKPLRSEGKSSYCFSNEGKEMPSYLLLS